jgi:hypothetical protein
MTAFESALAEYKAALLAAAPDIATDTQRDLYQLHVKAISDIERRYSETSNAYACRLLIEGEGIIHKTEVLKGPKVSHMKRAFSKLLDAVREAYGT